MPVPARAAARPRSPGEIRRLVMLVAIPLALSALAVGIASADLPSTALHLDAAGAARAGNAVRLVGRVVGGSTIVELQPDHGDQPRSPGEALLAVSHDGTQAALADRIGELSGVLTIARADGSQLLLQLPGLLAAGFAVDGSWLAVVDGRGAVWRVDAESGSATSLSPGPFIGSPIVADDGSLLLLAVPSVEAPWRSQLVRVEAATGVATPLSSDELVYGTFPLADGGIAIAAHESQGTVVRRIEGSGSQLLAELGPGAINVSVAPDARRIAYEREGAGIWLVDGPGAPPHDLGAGSRPCFAPDGSWLLVRRGTDRVALSIDGSVLATVDGLAGLVDAQGCLP